MGVIVRMVVRMTGMVGMAMPGRGYIGITHEETPEKPGPDRRRALSKWSAAKPKALRARA
ncbi:hypothetical protein NCCP691_05010 [Noviherbaspirillum aridicola]|uniref:Uncharacterized protein n=1 Tax=Noviherbaspirillum aridicola TaxID=2849687 RepID=A0ABQ4Q014_9BURK|nr:hypothetical protein NCCP691_05010 [Noviherbaspirillum aridicola]